jgi:hypothetical protein
VTNTDSRDLPYAIGFPPGSPVASVRRGKEGHRVSFEAQESDVVPEVAAGGLLARRSRRVPMEGRDLSLSPELFSEALVFLHAKSRTMRFEASDGAAIVMETENFPHLACGRARPRRSCRSNAGRVMRIGRGPPASSGSLPR